MMTPIKKPMNFNTILLTAIIILFGFFSMASTKWIERVEGHIGTQAVWGQDLEIRLAKVELCQQQTLDSLNEIKQILKNRNCQP